MIKINQSLNRDEQESFQALSGGVSTHPAPSDRIRMLKVDDIQKQRFAGALDAALEALERSPDKMLVIAQRLHRRLPALAPDVARVLFELRNGAIDALYVAGLPEGEERARLISVMFGWGVGFPFSYDLEGNGEIPMRITPRPGMAANTNSSRAEFLPHTDDSFLVEIARPDFLVLAGARSSSKVATFYSPIEAALRLVPEELRPVLFEPRYKVRTPISFELPSAVWSGLRPLLGRGRNGRTTISFPSFSTLASDPEAEAAMHALTAALEKVRQPFHVQPGCVLAFVNFMGTHSRQAIEDGADRLLFRTYARTSLGPLRSASGCEGPVFPLARLVELKE